MNDNFWKNLPKPFFVLAPMLDITDSPFRQMVSDCGKPDIFYTWFVSVDGLCSAGKNNILKNPNLKITGKERPIVVQLFGKDPDKFLESARIMRELGFDGIDINLGCPDKDVLKQGAGAELLNNPKLAGEIIRETKRGAGKIPVSVKTRIGFLKKQEMKGWISQLLEEKPEAISLHGRTCKQNYKGEADWDSIGEAAEISKGSGTLIIGNGDVASREDGILKAEKFGLDGIMIGRAALVDPWIFKKEKGSVPKEERLRILVKHAGMFEKSYERKSFNIFKKYLKGYVSGFDGAKELRMAMMKAESVKEMEKITESYLKNRTF